MIACAPQKKRPTVSYGCFSVTSLRRPDAIKPRGRVYIYIARLPLRAPEVFAPHGATKLGRAGARRRLGSLGIEACEIVPGWAHAEPSDDVDAGVVLGDVEDELEQTAPPLVVPYRCDVHVELDQAPRLRDHRLESLLKLRTQHEGSVRS